MDEDIRAEFLRSRDRLHEMANVFAEIQKDILEIKLTQARLEGTMVPLAKTWEAIQQVTLLVATVDKLANAHEIRLRAVEKIVWGAVMGILAAVLAAGGGVILWAAKWR